MSYKYSKGAQVIGDLKAADDAQRNTVIDFGEDQIELQTGGETRLKVENTQILTNVPIHISGTWTGTEAIRIGATTTSARNYREIQFERDGVDKAFIQLDSSNGLVIGCQSDDDEIIFMTKNTGQAITEAMRVRHGAVGVGTASPQRELHVSGSDARIRIEADTSNHPGLELVESGTRKWIIYNQPAVNDNLTFKTNSHDRMVIAQSGNVGIGTTAPDYELDVAGDIGINEKLIHNGDSNTYLAFSGQNEINLVANGHSFLKYDGAIKINNANRDRDTQIMADNGNVVLHVDAGTNKVGIGTTNPSYTLDISGSTRTAGAVYKNITVVTSFPYTVATDDYILLIKGSGERTINLPAISGELGRVLIIKDALGNSGGGSDDILLDGNGSETIDGQTTKPMRNDYKSMTIICGPDEWNRMSEFTSN